MIQERFNPSEGADRRREAADQLAKDSMLRGAYRTARPELHPSRPAVGTPVTMRDLAERLKMDRSACRRYVLRLGYKPTKMRTADSGYQMALTVSAQDARAIQVLRASEGYCDPPG